MKARTNPSDYISRHPLVSDKLSSKEIEHQEGYLNMVVDDNVSEAISIQRVKEAIDKDEKLSRLQEMVLSGEKVNVFNDGLAGYKQVWDELSVCDQLLMRGEKIVIPETLEDDVKIAHEGHMRTVKCKQFLRSNAWFPKMDKRVEKEIFKCLPCQTATDSLYKEAIKVSELPSGPGKTSLWIFGVLHIVVNIYLPIILDFLK